MPNAAIATGLVDVVENPNEMPALLAEYSTHAKNFFDTHSGPAIETEHDIYSPIFVMVNEAYDVDFQYYKPATIGRRIERRMALQRMQTVDRYIDFLRVDENELDYLYRDLLIGVTEFFRDRDIWDYLEKQIIPGICEKCSSDEELRFWIPGCATGEEAYSYAILVHEWLTNNHRPLNIRIFATDLHKGSLAIAGSGIYPEVALSNISKERIIRYFTKQESGNYLVNPEIRRMVVFASQNVLKDPPFTKLDLLSCRNLLIYFRGEAQAKALSLFHFALKAKGTLILGPSESLGDIEDEFEEHHRRFKVYSKRRDIKLSNQMAMSQRGVSIDSNTTGLRPIYSDPSTGGRDINLIRAYDSLLEAYAPPSILVRGNGILAHTFGAASDYMRPPSGIASLNLLDIIHSDLRTPIATGFQRVNKEPSPITYGGIKVTLNEDDVRVVRLTISPLSRHRPSDYLLINFEEITKIESRTPTIVDTKDESEPSSYEETDIDEVTRDHVVQLEQQLRYTKENLQATVEELETSNEELQATNEELMASNEELQSTNEELHSVNEELYTVNREHEEKIGELTQMTDDMDNLLASTEIGTIFLDQSLRIRKFTPAAARQFSLLDQDVGRPISHLNRNIEFDNFQNELQTVLNDSTAKTFEVRNTDKHWFLMGLHPYRSENKKTTGVVITFVEITPLRRASSLIERRNQDLQAFAYAISHDLNEPARLIMNFSELLVRAIENNDTNADTNQYMEQIQQASDRLRGMLDGTLEFSRVYTQTNELEPNKLSAIVDDAIEHLAEKIRRLDARVQYNDLPIINCDRRQITRLFSELIDNALQFSDSKVRPEISISHRSMPKKIYIYVSDNGIGVPKPFHDSIFNIFTRAHSHVQSSNNRGVGLSVVKRILERHEGKIHYESNEPVGSRFVMEINIDSD